MIHPLLERLVESPHRWLIVTAVTLVIALASGLPQVDQYLATQSERTDLREQLARASETAGLLPQYESRVEEITTQLKQLQDREVDETKVATLRSWLVDAARQAGCQVRRIDIGSPNERDWAVDDLPLAEANKRLPESRTTPFNLQTRPVTLSVTGSSTELRSLLRAIDADQRLKHPHTIDLRPEGRRRQLQLDLTLWYFALVRPAGVA